ncbi:hypothetical protein GQ44DRAFT_744699 [Phaeosphaeriaceae sp. PMI808]|nr:hypothetical protein GQ44DRAFT_744699 [Phaeosphaeriaceae sp. PMI808]
MQRPLRRSARLNPASGEHTKQQYSLTEKKVLRKTHQSTTPQPGRRKRSREAEDLPADIAVVPSPKRPRASRREHAWPKEYFEPDKMSHLLAKKKSTPSLRRKRSDSGSLAASSTTPSDQKPREEKNAPYQDPRYKTLLETKGIFMNEDRKGPKKESKDLCRNLLAEDQDIPQISRFSDTIFKLTYRRIDSRNEAKLANFGAKHLECLVEAVNKGWNNSIPVTKTRPQPNYSIGFKRDAFTEDQLKKLAIFISNFIASDQSFFMATYYMYFPFLTCENAHSMTLAVRAIVKLFQLIVYKFTKNVYDTLYSAIDDLPLELDFDIAPLL